MILLIIASMTSSPTIDSKLGRRYSSFLLLLPAHMHQKWLGPTRCCATHYSRSPPLAGALLAYIRIYEHEAIRVPKSETI